MCYVLPRVHKNDSQDFNSPLWHFVFLVLETLNNRFNYGELETGVNGHVIYISLIFTFIYPVRLTTAQHSMSHFTPSLFLHLQDSK